MLKSVARLFGAALDRVCGLPAELPLQSASSPARLAWVGGFPAHYMGEFHCRLQALHPAVVFLYVPFGQNGRAFAHEVTHLPANHICAKSRWQWLWCWRSLERINPASVLIAGNHPRTNLIAAAWARRRGRALYYLSDSNALDQRNLRRNRLKQLLLAVMLVRVTRILSIGSRNAEFYMQFINKEKLHEAILPFPLPHLHKRFETVATVAKDVFTFLVFGRLDNVKAVDRIISAYALLDKACQMRSRLLIAGDGAARSELEAQVGTLGLSDRVQFLGAVPSDQAPRVFGEANVLVLASHDEPWGLVVNEALSAGIPVIGPFWVGAFADLVVHQETGLVTPDNSASQLWSAMKSLLDDPSLAARMGQAGRTRVRERGWTIDGSLEAIGQLQELKEITE